MNEQMTHVSQFGK